MRDFSRRPSARSGEQGAADVSRPPQRINQLIIPEAVLQQTLVGLALGHTREMLAYWIGTSIVRPGVEANAVVTTVAFPKILSTYSQFQLVEGQMGLVTSWCASRGLWVLAQVHSHPTDEPHSEADETWPASHRKGFLSVVLPFFA